MKGVIITQDWGYHSYYKELVKTSNVIQYHRYDVFHIWLFLKCNLGYKPRLFVGHYDPSGGKPPGHFKLVVCRDRLNKA